MPTPFKNAECINIGGGWRIKSVEEMYCDTLQHICHLIDDIELSEETDSVITLKATPDKKVLLLTKGGEPFLIKTHLHESFGDRIKASWRNSGGHEKRKTWLRREFESTKTANRLAVPSSQMLGYGCRISKGFVIQELLVSSGSPDATPLIETLREQTENQKEIAKILQRTFNLISRMLKAGYVHLDMHSDNILLSGTGPGKDIIIDHEFASLFPENKLVEVAAFVFGYLYRCQVREHISFERYTVLVKQALSTLVENQQQLCSDFDSWLYFAAYTRVPKKERAKYLGL